MSNENFYVDLANGSTNEDSLVRKLNEEYKGKTFGEVVEYMLNPAGDNLNEAYSPMEMMSARGLQRDYNTRSDEESVTVSLTARQVKGIEEKYLAFTDQVNSCLDDILITETITNDQGKEEKLDKIYLKLTKVICNLIKIQVLAKPTSLV